MEAIIIEGVLFVALLLTLSALFTWILRNFTPLGTRMRQVQNRKQIERAAARVCPVHGAHEEHELVLLPHGERICPDCYQEAVDGYTD